MRPALLAQEIVMKIIGFICNAIRKIKLYYYYLLLVISIKRTRSSIKKIFSPEGRLESAKELLEQLRNGEGSCPPDYYAELIKGDLDLAGKNYDSINTSPEEIEELVKWKFFKRRAENSLKIFRDTSGEASFPHKWIVVECAEKGRFSLSDIGTSERELQELYRSGELKSAKHWLDHLKTSFTPEDTFEHLMVRLNNGNLTLADIGASEKEIQELICSAHRRNAESCLKRLRKNQRIGHFPESTVEFIKHSVQKSGFTINDIGTNDDELNSLIKSRYKDKASETLQSLRNWSPGNLDNLLTVQFSSPEVYGNLIRKYIERAGCELADIGTSEAEIAKLIEKISSQLQLQR